MGAGGIGAEEVAGVEGPVYEYMDIGSGAGGGGGIHRGRCTRICRRNRRKAIHHCPHELRYH